MENAMLFSTSAHLFGTKLRSGKAVIQRTLFSSLQFLIYAIIVLIVVCVYVSPEILALSHHAIVL